MGPEFWEHIIFRKNIHDFILSLSSGSIVLREREKR